MAHGDAETRGHGLSSSAPQRLSGRFSSNPCAWPWLERFSLKTAVQKGFKARKWPSHQGKEALWNPSETSPGG